MSQNSLRTLGRATLDKLTATSTTRDLMETTIIAMVWSDFMTGGHDRKEFWELTSTCAKSTWSKWKKNYPELTAVLDEMRVVLRGWGSDQSLAAIEDAKLILQLAAPDAARTAVSLMHDGSDPTNQRHAAFGILDRAAGETAPQGGLVIPDLDRILTKVYGTDDDHEETADNSDN